jgi:hypothetical protein
MYLRIGITSTRDAPALAAAEALFIALFDTFNRTIPRTSEVPKSTRYKKN